MKPVKTEISLHALAYSLKRVIATLGAKPLMISMQAQSPPPDTPQR